MIDTEILDILILVPGNDERQEFEKITHRIISPA